MTDDGLPIKLEPADLVKLLQRDRWSDEEFKYICLGINHEKEFHHTDEILIRLREVEKYIAEGRWSGALSRDIPPEAGDAERLYGGYFYYAPFEAITWATARPALFPEFPDFSPYLSEAQSHRPNLLSKKPDEIGIDDKINPHSDSQAIEHLNHCKAWQEFQTKASLAIKLFPEWQQSFRAAKPKRKFLQADVIDWLKSEIKANDREAEIIKRFLQELFSL